MRPIRAVLAFLLTAAAVLLPTTASPARTPESRPPFDLPAEVVESFDAVLDLVPDASCASVRVGATTLYSRNGSEPVIPASTLKILTAIVALDVLGPDHRFTTRLVGPEASDGVIRGDIALVGGGDPMLATDEVIEHRDIADRNPTRLDRLADALADAGVRQIEGGVIGDEGRYDDERTVATWPERFVSQNQAGPLSALGVNAGYDWQLDGPASRDRSGDPAASAADSFRDLLEERGIAVTGSSASGPAPDGTLLASIDSAPLRSIVETLLLTSDNRIAESLVKELAVDAGQLGTTSGGMAILRARAAELGLDVPGSRIVDGSGLDPTNRMTCDQLVDILDHAGGADSRIGQGLPVAGRSGTLAHRFRDTPVEGRVKAKTGRLNLVSSLAGYAPLHSGESSSFAIVVNGNDDDQHSQDVQELFVGLLLATDLPCHVVHAPIVVPTTVHVASMGSMSMFPLQAVTGPSTMVPFGLIAAHPEQLLHPCLVENDAFSVALTG